MRAKSQHTTPSGAVTSSATVTQMRTKPHTSVATTAMMKSAIRALRDGLDRSIAAALDESK